VSDLPPEIPKVTIRNFCIAVRQALVDVYLALRDTRADLRGLTTADVVATHLSPQLRAARSSCVAQMLKAPPRPPAFAVLHCAAAPFEGLVRSLQVRATHPGAQLGSCGDDGAAEGGHQMHRTRL
jgi:hypothetical protein